MNYKHSARLAFSTIALGTYSIFGCSVNDYPTSAVQEQSPSHSPTEIIRLEGYTLPYSPDASLPEKIKAVENLVQAISDTLEGLVVVFVYGPGNSMISSRENGSGNTNMMTIYDPSLDASLPFTPRELREIIEATD